MHESPETPSADERMEHAASDMEFKGTWAEFKGTAKQLWGELTDDDLDVAEGKTEELMGRVQRKTGESLEAIRAKIFGTPDKK
jgi:uncharacterized protein YjbJ (UPF0337 family)